MPRRSSTRELTLAEEVRFDQELDRNGNVREVRIALEEGTRAEVELPLEVAELLISLDGSTDARSRDRAHRTPARAQQARGGGAPGTTRLRISSRDLFEQGFFELTRVRA